MALFMDEAKLEGIIRTTEEHTKKSIEQLGDVVNEVDTLKNSGDFNAKEAIELANSVNESMKKMQTSLNNVKTEHLKVVNTARRNFREASSQNIRNIIN